MNTLENIWRKLSESKGYRAEFALAFLKRSVAFQIKTLRKKHCGSQTELAERSNLTQGVVSRAEDQDYGNLTFNTVGRIAAGLDMAFIGRFVSFSEFVKYSRELSEAQLAAIPTFRQENEALALGSVEQGICIREHGNLMIFGLRRQPQREERDQGLGSAISAMERSTETTCNYLM